MLLPDPAEITAALAQHPLLGPAGPVAERLTPSTEGIRVLPSGRRPAVVEFGGVIHLPSPQLARPDGADS
ncbi:MULTISPECIES: hypothetical protein [unclassified Kitasatospora]|uniref:hypothetical protein n=1 Tax=unclassified Kitasatospora TaxID=2633591 RepID=UPI00247652F9|nr:hypothetical protein [Kitasatospora sp. MAP12-44]